MYFLCVELRNLSDHISYINEILKHYLNEICLYKFQII
jgi:hypothetical protein